MQSDGSYPYQYSEGSDFVKNLAIPTIDFGTFHLYPDSCTFIPRCTIAASLTIPP